MKAVAAESPDDAAILAGSDQRAASATSELLDRQRPLRRPTALGGEARDEPTLIDHLCTIDGLSGDLSLPLKATLSRTYLLTKINFLRGFVKATGALHDRRRLPRRMTHELREEVAQSIYTLLAEELFLALLRKPDCTRRTKQRAADQLITIWDDADTRDRRFRAAARVRVARAQPDQQSRTAPCSVRPRPSGWSARTATPRSSSSSAATA